MVIVIFTSMISLVMIYLFYDFMMPIVAQIDSAEYNQVISMGPWITSTWMNSYTSNGVWIMHDAFYWSFWGFVIAIISFTIIYAVRRQPNQTQQDIGG
jgi:hypothetical protein